MISRAAAATVFALGLLAPRGPGNAQNTPLYAYVPVPGMDRNGQPVRRPDGTEVRDGFCILWRPGQLTSVEVPVTVDRVWWRGVSYTIDPRARRVAVRGLRGPDVVALPGGGWREVGRRDIHLRATSGPGIIAPLFEHPQKEWPCTEQTWASIRASERTVYVQRPGGGSSSGGAATASPSARSSTRAATQTAVACRLAEGRGAAAAADCGCPRPALIRATGPSDRSTSVRRVRLYPESWAGGGRSAPEVVRRD
jgi:hypothetical protein